jgi:hypothetical protein
MTQISAGTAPLSGSKDGYVPALDCSYTPVGSLSQLWIMGAAIEHYGSRDRMPLPIPLDFASKHPGPAEVNVTVLAFGGTAQPRALLTNPEFSTGVRWTKLPDAAIHEGNAFRIDSEANDGQDEFLLQWASDNRWIDVSIAGASLTIEQAQRVAESVGTSSR